MIFINVDVLQPRDPSFVKSSQILNFYVIKAILKESKS